MSNFYLVAGCNISNLYKKILQLFSISFFCFGIYWHFFLIVWYFIPWTIKNKSASILKCKLTHWFSALKIITYKELRYSGVQFYNKPCWRRSNNYILEKKSLTLRNRKWHSLPTLFKIVIYFFPQIFLRFLLSFNLNDIITNQKK